MSKISLKLELVFDNHEAWNTVDDFTNAFVKFLTSQQLIGEKIKDGKDNPSRFYLYISKSPNVNPPLPKQPSIKESLVKLKPKK